MSRQDAVRRATTVVLVALCLVLVPGWASARFTGAGTGAVSVGTARVVAPTAVTGTYTCYRSGLTEGVRFAVTGFADGGSPGLSYRYGITRGTAATVYGAQTTTSRSVTVDSGAQAIDLGSTRYTLSIRVVAGSWTSTAWTREVSCPAGGSASGPIPA